MLNYDKSNQLERINGQYIIKEIRSILNFDKGILYTIRELILRPGDSIKKFIREDRNRIVKPITFLIFSTIILTLTNRTFELNLGTIQDEINNTNLGVKKILKWFGENQGFGNILKGVFIGFITKLFFRKSNFNIYEIFVLIFFIIGIVNLIFAFGRIIQSLIGIYYGNISLLFGFLYFAWALGNFFAKNKFLSYMKALLAYLLGSILSYILIVSIGNLLNIYIKSS
jgi:hypothetical protein